MPCCNYVLRCSSPLLCSDALLSLLLLCMLSCASSKSATVKRRVRPVAFQSRGLPRPSRQASQFWPLPSSASRRLHPPLPNKAACRVSSTLHASRGPRCTHLGQQDGETQQFQRRRPKGAASECKCRPLRVCTPLSSLPLIRTATSLPRTNHPIRLSHHSSESLKRSGF